MRYDETWLDWCVTGEREEADDASLDGAELGRAEYLAEHPELADPLIGLLPERRARRGGGAQ